MLEPEAFIEDHGAEGDREKGSRVAFLNTAILIKQGWPRSLYGVIQSPVESFFGLSDLQALYEELVEPSMNSTTLARRALEALRVSWDFCSEDLSCLKAVKGPLVVAANHPFGGIDFFSLALYLEKVRPGNWKFLSNEMLGSIPGFDQNLIPLDPLQLGPNPNKTNRSGLRRALNHLSAGGVLGFFPAGRVSHRQGKLNGAVADREWSAHLLKLARVSGAGIACLQIPGQNSERFLRIPPDWRRLRALMLCRELTRPPVSTVKIRLAIRLSPSEVVRLEAEGDAVRKLRAICYLRADRELPYSVPTSAAAIKPGTKAKSQLDSEVASEMECLRQSPEKVVTHSGPYDLLFFRGDQHPKLLEHLGEIREASFRMAGQGTGRDTDHSREDNYYHHLLLWDGENKRIAGAYRLGMVSTIRRERGDEGLYLNQAFRIKRRFYQKIGRAIELSRSFIVPEYQKNPRALAGLWKGLGAVVKQHQIETLFGSVTISNAYHPASRAILVNFLKNRHGDCPEMRAHIQARQPFEPLTQFHTLVSEAYRRMSLEKLVPLIDRLENGERSMPTLLRHYKNLGARYLDFHVEKSFQNAIYCLLRVEIAALPPAYQKRFLGTSEYCGIPHVP